MNEQDTRPEEPTGDSQPFDKRDDAIAQQGGSGSTGGPDYRGSQHGTLPASDEDGGASSSTSTDQERVGE